MNSMKIIKPLSDEHIQAADKIYAQCPNWKQTDTALKLLSDRFPGFERESCLLKSVAINTLYGTQVWAIAEMANHVCETISKNESNKDKPELLVDAIATVGINGGKIRHFISFASKFCHFFVNDGIFPIYDQAARETLALHLGKQAMIAGFAESYTAFCGNIACLRAAPNLTCSLSALDRYLWLRGLLIKFEKRGVNAEINGEIKQYFQRAKAKHDINFMTLIN